MSDICLKWTSQFELLGSLDHLYETQSFVDVTIAVEGQQLKAHRVVLCACSWYFSSILRSNTTPHPIIFMRDVKFVEMKAILDFIYKGEAFVPHENIQGFLKTAEALKVSGLSNISWTESPVNYVGSMQTGETSSNVIVDFQNVSKQTDSVTIEMGHKDGTQEILPSLNDNSISNSSEYQNYSTEEGIVELIKKGTAIERDSQQESNKLVENFKDNMARVSTSGDGETMMILEAPSNIAITSVPGTSARPKPLGRQYTKEDLQQALELIRQGQMGIKPAARAFNIPVATLHHAARRSKISSPMQQGGNHIVPNRAKIKPKSSEIIMIKSEWTSSMSTEPST